MKSALLAVLCAALWFSPAKAEMPMQVPEGVSIGASPALTARSSRPGRIVLAQSRSEIDALGEGAGAYLYGAYVMNAAAKSECSYLVKNPMNPSDALVEVQTFVAPFEDVDWGNLIADIRSEADKFVDGYLAAARKDDTTQDARCGLLLGVVASVYEAGRRRWVAVKSRLGVK